MPRHTDRAAPSRGPRQAGVALIEVLVSILLFSIALLGLIGLQAQATSLSLEADYRSRAALLADEIAAQVWMKKTVALDSDAITSWKNKVASSASLLPSGTGGFDRVGSTNAVDITITWKPPSRSSTDAASSFRTRVTVPSL
ncbi:type IV pilus assembly protein PilV [Pseudacidovorax intermedius]|uniref:Type IV pilus assembly protein PilV n=1 Tax=Pseudacidovorax intermedius TaxID=433924 RepID=A0A370FBE2_9BURK|nr:prepilin-type N-terminal cleavage/methylation domain-containing protein [Pseudacidovorax intermedius]RDI21926.1 type IV pilus assembly protein PilV [Pseudacidovorax intermedius]